MRIVWDQNKNRSNRLKHKVSSRLPALSLKTLSISASWTGSKTGKSAGRRWGMVGNVVVLLIAHTYAEQEGGEVVRIISACRATREERQKYEEDR